MNSCRFLCISGLLSIDFAAGGAADCDSVGLVGAGANAKISEDSDKSSPKPDLKFLPSG